MPKKQALERWIVSRWEKGGTVASREKERQIEAFSRTVPLTWRQRWRRCKTLESVCHKPEIFYYKRKIPSEIKLASPKRSVCLFVCLSVCHEKWSLSQAVSLRSVSRFQVGFSWFQVGFHGFYGSRLVFHGSSWFFIVLGWFFMVFNGSRLVFHGFSWF